MSEPGRPKARVVALAGALLALALLFAAGAAEVVARLLEPSVDTSHSFQHDPDPELGWVPRPGKQRSETTEFSVVHDVNAEGMHDDPLPADLSAVRMRIVALGDSHTFAAGIAKEEVWPNQLEKLLFDDRGDGAVYNLGVVGYGLGQYLLRYRRMAHLLQPQVLVIGFSMATDLYDLIPPERGGFVYGAEKGRVYFDLDASGALVEKRDLVGKTISPREAPANRRLRGLLENVALYRRFKRSSLGLWVAMRYRPGGTSLWPGMDTAMKRDLDPDDRYRWDLAAELIEEIAREARANGVQTVVLVSIPYLAQVYDDMWQASFGSAPALYDREIAGERLRAICAAAGIEYVDTTPRFVEEVRRQGTWLHYPQDAHPTPAGQRLIAQVVADALAARLAR